MTGQGEEQRHDQYEDAPEDDIPLHRKQPFGSGLKRKRVVFVPASSASLDSTEERIKQTPSRSISDLYRSLVLPAGTVS